MNGVSVSQTDYLLINCFPQNGQIWAFFLNVLPREKKKQLSYFFALILSVLLDIFLILKYNKMDCVIHILYNKDFQ